MAEGGQQAQTLLVCQFCDKNLDVKFKCLDCRMALCTPCKNNLHSKLLFQKEHKIVDIRDLSEQELAVVGERAWNIQITCATHAPNIGFLFCKTCDKVVCSSCVLEGHNTHELTKFQSALEDKMSVLRGVIENIDQKLLKEIQKEQQTFDEQWSNQQRHGKAVEDKILKTTDELLQKVKDKSSKMLSQHKLFYTKMNNEFVSTKQNLDNQEQQYLDHRNKLETILGSENPIEILNLSNDTLTPPTVENPSVVLSNSVLGITEGEFTEDQLRCCFGNLLTVSSIKSFNTHLPDINVLCAKEGYIWINNKERRILSKLMLGADIEEEQKLDDIEATDFSIYPNGDVILKLSKSNKVKILMQKGRMKVFRDFSPVKPTAVHVNAIGEVFVGTKELGPNFTVPSTGKRQVQIFSVGGRLKDVVEYDDDKRRLFTYVWCITTTQDGDIAVIDRLSDEFNGKIVTLNNALKLQWTFKGNTSREPLIGQFKPRCIVATNDGMVIVSERLTHSLYLLDSKTGKFLSTIDTSQLNIFLPQSLSIDPLGNLWIGCGSYRGAKDDAKIHLVSCSFLH